MNQIATRIIYISLILGSILTTGCRKSDIQNPDQGEHITFGCDSIISRSAGFDNTNNPILNMGIYSTNTAADWTANDPINFFNKVPVVRANANSPWNTPKAYYWPNNGKLSFFAYAPFNTSNNPNYNTDLTINTAAGGAPVMTFEVRPNHAFQVDLMVATAVKNLTKSTNNNQPVNFKMAHALTRVSFAGRISEKMTDAVVVTQIWLKQYRLKGSCNMDASGLKWTPDPANAKNNSKLTSNTGLINQTLTHEYLSLVAPTDYLYLMPQVIDPDMALEVDYTINGVAQPAITFKMSEVITEWQPGQALRLLINISPRPFEATLDYRLEDWVNQPINVPIEEDPYLYVSDVETRTYDAAVTRVHFETNQKPETVFMDPFARLTNINGAAIDIKSKFMDLVDGDRLGKKNFHYTYNAATGKGAGYFDLVNVIDKFSTIQGVLLPTAPPVGDQTPVLVRLRAGKLDYYVTVKPHITAYVAQTSTGTSTANVTSPPPQWLAYYSSTFHRRNQVGERIVTWFFQNNDKWRVKIVNVGDGDELVIDRLPSPDYAANLLYSNSTRDAEGAIVSEGTSTTRQIEGRGRIYIRIGWKSTAKDKNRYAKVEVYTSTYNHNTEAYEAEKYLADIHCRQGEEPDFIRNSTDDMFSPYNVVGDGVHGEYPTQGGFISQWGRPRQWSLDGFASPSGYPTTIITEELDRDVSICPDGYTYPDGTTTGQYIDGMNKMSSFSGFCADGYFDRRHETNWRVNPDNVNNAATGTTLFVQGSLDAKSIFFPSTGFRDETGKLLGALNGTKEYAGMIGIYWTNAENAADKSEALAMWFQAPRPALIKSGYYDKRHSALMRCIKVKDPVYVTFNSNGAESHARRATAEKGDKVYIPKKIPTLYWRPSYYFYSWNANSNGTGTEYFPGTETPTAVTSDMTIYAKWSPFLRVDFTKLMTATELTQYTTATSYLGLSIGNNGNPIAVAQLTGATALTQVAMSEKAYHKIEFHDIIKTATDWAVAYADCKALSSVGADGVTYGAGSWRLPRLLEVMLMSQNALIPSWARSDLFGGEATPMWTATQFDALKAHQTMYYNTATKAIPLINATPINYRCVRELP